MAVRPIITCSALGSARLIGEEDAVSWRTHRLVVLARHIGRVLGLNRWMAVRLNGRGYETRYDQAFSLALRSGDCVWDVGANVGYYTHLFSDRVGNEGKIFAFEPSPVNFARLQRACADLTNVQLHPLGLGRDDGTLSFVQGADDLGATSRVIDVSSHPESGQIMVEIRAGQYLIEKGEALPPNAIKIDVEGFELEVLQGLGKQQLQAPALRAIGVEVHFGILNARGIPNAPQQIERLLQQSGFRVQWPDSSHILATRFNS